METFCNEIHNLRNMNNGDTTYVSAFIKLILPYSIIQSIDVPALVYNQLHYVHIQVNQVVTGDIPAVYEDVPKIRTDRDKSKK